jgi:hypothetical protein
MNGRIKGGSRLSLYGIVQRLILRSEIRYNTANLPPYKIATAKIESVARTGRNGTLTPEEGFFHLFLP